MAEEFGQSKTFAPTPRRRDEARKQGHVALSLDLTNSVQLLAAVVGLWFGASAIAFGLLDIMRVDFADMPRVSASNELLTARLGSSILRAAGLVASLVGLLLVTGLAISTSQVGFAVVPSLLSPRLDRMSLAKGWERMFSSAAAMRGVMSVLKVAIIAGVTAWILRGKLGQLQILAECNLATALAGAWNITIRLALAVAAALVVIGAADYLYQRWRQEHALMMTAQEMKEQLREDDGDPATKARLRRLAREVTKNRQMKDVPSATVVITNPTHLAIALRYDRGTMPAPRVVAKGSGLLARRIADLARRHGVPVIERKPLAQALFKAVKVGQEIPAALYYAVAEVLAYVYRLAQSV
jgi:flagellar biosynthetic protein FlhB